MSVFVGTFEICYLLQKETNLQSAQILLTLALISAGLYLWFCLQSSLCYEMYTKTLNNSTRQHPTSKQQQKSQYYDVTDIKPLWVLNYVIVVENGERVIL